MEVQVQFNNTFFFSFASRISVFLLKSKVRGLLDFFYWYLVSWLLFFLEMNAFWQCCSKKTNLYEFFCRKHIFSSDFWILQSCLSYHCVINIKSIFLKFSVLQFRVREPVELSCWDCTGRRAQYVLSRPHCLLSFFKPKALVCKLLPS